MGGVVGDVISFIGKPFGIYTHNEIFTEIQIINLLTAGKADSSARKASIRGSGGDAKLYHTSYRAFQRQYKRRYSKKFLESVGYNPTNTATSRTVDLQLALDYITALTGYQTITLSYCKDLYIDLEKKGDYGKQFSVGYDFVTSSANVDGKSYAYINAEEVTPTEIKLNFVRNYIDSIEDNLTINYQYDSVAGTVSINGELYDITNIGSFINQSDQYETVCIHASGTLPDEVIYTQVERYSENYTNTLFSSELTYIKYITTSGEIDANPRYFIAEADTLPIYSYKTIDMTAIIPMKEDNVIVNENNNLKRVLKKLNLSQDQLVSSLENPDMDAAYLMTGLDTTIDDNTHNKVMFKTFDYLYTGDGSMTISISKLKMKYSYFIVKTTIQGVVSEVGKYTRTGFNAKGITLRYQGSATEYQQIVLSDYDHRYTISGRTLVTNFSSDTTRLVIPLDIFNSLRYKEWENIYENSLCMIGYSMEVVEIKWYETAAFGTLLQIVGIVMLFWGGIQAASLFEYIVTVIVNYAIFEIILILAEAIGGELGAIIGAALAIYIVISSAGTNGSTGTELWLKAASQGLTVINQFIAEETKEKLNNFINDIEELDRKINDLKEDAKEYEDNSFIYASATLPFESIGKQSKIFQTTEQYVNSIVNTEWLVDGSWMYDIEGEIASRNSVYVG